MARVVPAILGRAQGRLQLIARNKPPVYLASSSALSRRANTAPVGRLVRLRCRRRTRRTLGAQLFGRRPRRTTRRWAHSLVRLRHPFGRRANTTVRPTGRQQHDSPHGQTLGAQSCAPPAPFGRRRRTRRFATTRVGRRLRRGGGRTRLPHDQTLGAQSCAPRREGRTRFAGRLTRVPAEGRTRRFAPRPDVGRTVLCASGTLRQKGEHDGSPHNRTLGAQSCAPPAPFGRRANTMVRPTIGRWAHSLVRLRRPSAEGRTRRFAPRPDVGRTVLCVATIQRVPGRGTRGGRQALASGRRWPPRRG